MSVRPATPCSTPATAFLPTTAAEMNARGWDAVDVVFVSGDAYLDHPSFAAALLGRVLQAEGFRVAILPQPAWHINRNDVLRDYDNRHLEGWFQKTLDDVRPDAVHFFHLRQLGSNLIAVARRGCGSAIEQFDHAATFTAVRRVA